ncbi:presenilin-associated rhomboid-like protein, mitochondrial isoform X1 [Heteronotia binoei]|uniref:presenilin-associated rhomboid-like protein, mitochondrial isoform X1 n=1 Tax=Heteronotia binoei TaxID=13085 RepID=UPI00292D85B6|nr:presenilin-associated rhomboid-like protein, mitochondrial isoform X1 [Heteronotia binoei]XP_060097890.1 presenilin-associated rhomboid-like protein, mitochondrial isoform X1 [Heteronotia binoei]
MLRQCCRFQDGGWRGLATRKGYFRELRKMAWTCCARVWVRREFWSSGTRARRSTLYTQQRNGFRRPAQKTSFQRPNSGTSTKPQRSGLSPPVEDVVFPTPSHSVKKLVKPFFFTIGFSGCAFGSAAIWQYETLKTKFQKYFENTRTEWMDKIKLRSGQSIRKEINLWWKSLSEGQRAVSGIIAANVLVFCLWRVPAMQRIMVTYFTSNPASRVLCFPMVLSTFSHFSFLHMAANMYVLWSFSTSIVSLLGREQFMAVYFSAGVVSTFVSYVCKGATGRFGPSLGASGAIMTILAAVCTKMPEAKLAIIFLPMFTFTAGNALKAIIAMDSAGLVLGWKFFDHAAHLGGALFGMWYVTYGNELIWKNREPLVKAWHNIRTGSSKK